jgi:arylsulfatase A-like enzyme
LVRLLEAQELTDRSVVVLTSDHGQEFTEHGAYTYGHTLYDEVVRVPLIVAGPGVASPGQVVATPVGLLDLVPTLTDIAGAGRPPEAGGRSLAPALRGQTLVEESVFSEGLMRVPYESKAIRKDGYKLIYYVDDGRIELYDLAVDPAEMEDLAAHAAELGETMKRELLDWMDDTGQVARDLPRAMPPTDFSGSVW